MKRHRHSSAFSCTKSPTWGGRSLRDLAMFLLFVPVAVLSVTFVLGCIVAAFEGWAYTTGVQYVFSMQAGLANPLGQANNVSPATFWGRLATGIIGSCTLCCPPFARLLPPHKPHPHSYACSFSSRLIRVYVPRLRVVCVCGCVCMRVRVDARAHHAP